MYFSKFWFSFLVKFLIYIYDCDSDYGYNFNYIFYFILIKFNNILDLEMM